MPPASFIVSHPYTLQLQPCMSCQAYTCIRLASTQHLQPHPANLEPGSPTGHLDCDEAGVARLGAWRGHRGGRYLGPSCCNTTILIFLALPLLLMDGGAPPPLTMMYVPPCLTVSAVGLQVLMLMYVPPCLTASAVGLQMVGQAGEAGGAISRTCACMSKCLLERQQRGVGRGGAP